MVAARDTVLGALGAATALAGLTLVFFGVVVTRYEGIVAGASRRVRARAAMPAVVLFLTFLVGLASVAVSFAWLAAGGGHGFYVAVIVVFALQLGATALASSYLTFGVLFRG